MRIVSTLGWILCGLISSSYALNFLSIGDWGEVNSDQAKVAKEMKKIAKSNNISFVLALGDNFYEDGVVSDTDSQWQTTFRDVYLDDNSPLDVPWFGVLGNHDYHSNADAQIQYTLNRRDNNWKMPAHYYKESFSGSGFTLDMFFIDTIWFAPTESGSTHITNATEKYNEQLTWFKNQVTASDATYKIVVGHYPVFSLGGHGDCDDNAGAIQHVMEVNEVDAYLCGHDHTLQHLTNNNVEYFVSGNGALSGKIHKKRGTKAKKINLATVDPGFMLHEVTSSGIVTKVIDHSGTQVYKHTIKPKRASLFAELF